MYLATLIRRAPHLVHRSRQIVFPSWTAAYQGRLVPLRQYSSQDGQQSDKRTENNDPKEKVKVRRAYALGGCLMFMWLSMHGLLLYRRRNEYRKLNEKLPPISWEEFVDKYLLLGKVKSIVYQPQFEVGNVYLHSATEQKMKKVLMDWIHAAPDKFSRPPDVRFEFDGDGAAVEKAILELQKMTRDSPRPLEAVEFELDRFPSPRELAFIVISTLFTFAAVVLVK
ncbi:hypothetical protein Q1695_004970 [Nippostrongylus brasiliensis]|nr:hypothetical protein Q1695_004970 [Nippostrongylus brasiliensis]